MPFCSDEGEECYVSEHNYTSEFMYLMDEILDDEVTTRLRCIISKYCAYTNMADETSINNKSLLGVYARFLVESGGSVDTVKELIFITAVTSTIVGALFDAIDVGFSSLKIETNCLKCVSFDGASVMSSPDNGLYGLMKRNWNLPQLVYQHCRAHRLQLVSKAVSKDFPVVEDSIAGVQVLYTFFQKINKRYELLKGANYSKSYSSRQVQRAHGYCWYSMAISFWCYFASSGCTS